MKLRRSHTAPVPCEEPTRWQKLTETTQVNILNWLLDEVPHATHFVYFIQEAPLSLFN